MLPGVRHLHLDLDLDLGAAPLLTCPGAVASQQLSGFLVPRLNKMLGQDIL